MNWIYGRLSWNAFDHDWIELAAAASMVLGVVMAAGYVTYAKRWKWLWSEWITTLDHKKIGVMYMVVSFIMLAKGFVDALMMRLQQVWSVGDSFGYLTASHYQQIFTAHGATMIFFVAMGVVVGLMNILVPLQIGARDIAFPFLNSVGFWLFAVSAAMLDLSLIIGNFSGAGWLGYPPLTSLEYSPGVGVDYWSWILQIAGAGTLITGINFMVTIFKMRCPGMTLMKMPLFTWCTLATMILVVYAFPIITVALGLLSLDRYMGMHFFTSNLGGNPMMFVNLIWAWGHPEVYILVLPAFGIFSEVVAAFSLKPLFGYTSMVWAIIGITFLSFVVWLHHFFTMGAGPTVNAFFGVMTMLIAIPTGVKVFNWLFTNFRGRIHFTTPMLWFIGFVLSFSVGGMGGVLMAIPPADFQIHNSLFLIAHFHSMIIPGVLFAFFAGFTFWFPKVTGIILDEKLGRYAFWCWLVGFLLAFVPLYILGFMGATRRLDHYEASTGWWPMFAIAGLGSIIIAVGIGIQVYQVMVSIKRRHRPEYKDATGDPWNARTLEWATASPPPYYNFAVIPTVEARDAFWDMKEKKLAPHRPQHYEEFHMPKNTALGLYIGIFSALGGFGVIWHMMWLGAVGAIGVVVCIILRLMDPHTEFTVTKEEIRKLEENR